MTVPPYNSFKYNLTQDYLEVARSALNPIHGKVSNKSQESDTGPSPELANAIFSVVSISIVYSFLSLESFLNYQLHQIWERRHDNSIEANRFLEELGDESEFINLKGYNKIRDLPEKLKTICHLFSYPKPYEAIPKTWQHLNDLVKVSRHFIVHPYPDSDYFNTNMSRIMMVTEGGIYVKVVEDIIKFLYKNSSKPIPDWVSENQLIEFRGVNLIPIQKKSAN